MILAGDVGGTKTRLGLYDTESGGLNPHHLETFISRDYARLEDLVRAYLAKHAATVRRACIGVPGPVVDGEARTSNLPWIIIEAALEKEANIERVTLVNDLVATVASLSQLRPESLLVIHDARAPSSATIRGVLAPGTGLGQACVSTEGGRETFLPSEGGHADFAPQNDVEIELLRHLRTRFARVSSERVLSGPGLVNIYSFLRDTALASESPALKKQMAEENPNVVISREGLSGREEICVRTLDIFASVLGSLAGNLVLTFMATGGMYLGGGIPPKIAEKLLGGTTRTSYLKKGRLSPVVAGTPLYLICDDHAALHGAAHIAASS